MARVRCGVAVLALAAVAAVAADAVALSGGLGGRRGCPTASGPDPLAVAARFLATAVQRRRLRDAYPLALPALRPGISCEQWARGRVPVVAIPRIDWDRTGYRVIATGEGQVLRVFLYRPQAELPTRYLMEVQEEEVGWQVGYFDRDRR